MTLNFVRNIIFIVVLLLVQTLVLNHVRLFGCATPLLIVYFALTIHRGQARWASLLWCFAAGLLADIFSNTPGVTSASMTLIALLQPYLLELFVPRDSADDMRPSPLTLGMGKYANYTIVLVAVFTLTFFSLEAFNFYNWMQWLSNFIGSAVLTTLLILVIENFRRRK